MIDTEGYVLMDYDGKPVSIENGEKYYWDGDEGEHWNPATLSFELDDEDEDFSDDDEPCGNDRELYGLGWYDCNTDWRNWHY